jgi:hypothetical protein
VVVLSVSLTSSSVEVREIMGCDIHMYVEHRARSRRDGSWWSFGGRLNPGRYYGLFGYIAGVRGGGPPVVAPRGVPDDMAWSAREDWWLWINYDGTAGESEVSPETARKYVESYGCVYHGEVRPHYSRTITSVNGEVTETARTYGAAHDGSPRYVSHPDWHTPTWLTADELRTALALAGSDEPEYGAIVAAMEHMEAKGHDTRVVIWFDN